MSRQNPTNKSKRKRISSNTSKKEITVAQAYDLFRIAQKEKGNSIPTIKFYDRAYKKLSLITNNGDSPLSVIAEIGFQERFVISLGNVNQQTVNAYLRGYRAFGNYCKENNYIDSFSCPIKEIEPPVKNVYTVAELKRLIKKPSIENFVEFRSYVIILLLLSTGARSNTILNIRISDVDLEDGYINYNTTKTNKVVRIGLSKKTKRDLAEYIKYWRTDNGTDPNDYLFCSVYGEQLSRCTLCTSIAKYNKSRGVEKTSLHLFRHTFAKNWITSGGDLISLAKVLTHSELEMVKRYANLYGSDIKQEIEEHSTLSQLRTHSGETIVSRKRKML